MSKNKTKFTGKILYQSDPDFDWTPYDSGYNGTSLVLNTKVKTTNKKDKVFCHESYAQEMYDMLNAHMSGNLSTAKDLIKGTIFTVKDINLVSEHEVSVDTDNGMSAVIDLNKEHQFVKSIGCNSVKEFVSALKDNTYKKELLSTSPTAKVLDSNRVSLWEGTKAGIENEFISQLNDPNAKQYAYAAKVLRVISGTNGGGYIVDINGVECFLPGSLASSGPISDFNALVGKTIMVCIVNYTPKTNSFIVSYKKYLERVLPSRIENELEAGMEVSVRVTGISKNGVFVAIKDNKGEYIFPSLLHRSCMSTDFEESFNNQEFIVGDMFKAFIHRIDVVDGNYRIVLGDKAPALKPIESNNSGE